MSSHHEDVLRAALQLSRHERMLLAEELIESVPDDTELADLSDAELLVAFGNSLPGVEEGWGGPDYGGVTPAF